MDQNRLRDIIDGVVRGFATPRNDERESPNRLRFFSLTADPGLFTEELVSVISAELQRETIVEDSSK